MTNNQDVLLRRMSTTHHVHETFQRRTFLLQFPACQDSQSFAPGSEMVMRDLTEIGGDGAGRLILTPENFRGRLPSAGKVTGINVVKGFRRQAPCNAPGLAFTEAAQGRSQRCASNILSGLSMPDKNDGQRTLLGGFFVLSCHLRHPTPQLAA